MPALLPMSCRAGRQPAEDPSFRGRSGGRQGRKQEDFCPAMTESGQAKPTAADMLAAADTAAHDSGAEKDWATPGVVPCVSDCFLGTEVEKVYLSADHGQSLALRGVDLAWHDAGARLVLGQVQLI